MIEIHLLIVCFLIILGSFIMACYHKKKIYNKKTFQLIGSLILGVVLGCGIWRGAENIPGSNLGPEGNAVLMLCWIALGVANIILLLFYIGAFKHDII